MARKKNVIAPNEEKAVVAMDKQQKAIENATKLYGDGEPFSVERILDCMAFRSEQVSKNADAFGRYCLWLKEGIGWGGFVKALENRQFDVKAAYWAMLQVEKFGDNFHTVRNLGSRKSRVLTFFTKEEIEKYVEGGDLRGIPHDDVTEKTATELEEEVRALRKQAGSQKAKHEKIVKEMSAELETLRLRDNGLEPPTKEQIAGAKLEEFRQPFIENILLATERMRQVLYAIDNAQKIEHITFPQIEEFQKRYFDDFTELGAVYAELEDAFNFVHVEKGEGDGQAG